MSQSPSFSLTGSRYDQKTFSGRFWRMLDVIDPRTLLVPNEELQQAVKLLEDYKHGIIGPCVTDEDLWEARKIKEAILHPDTHEKVPMPFRMAGFVPFGTVIVVGMLFLSPTFTSTLFWQWANQTHNALVNYYNRNATKPTPTSLFVSGYIGAVASAMTVAGGLSTAISRSTVFSPATKSFVLRMVPFPAVATANVCNVVLMRFNELKEGIVVTTMDGQQVGTSRIAARKALKETAITRIALPAPILILPPLIMSVFDRTATLKRFPVLRMPLQAAVCTAAFGLALPLAIALFPQYGEINVSHLEPELQGLHDAHGQPITKVIYNKGL